MSMTVTAEILQSSHKQTIREVCASGWTLAYPEWVRETFTTALKTPVLPPYAVGQVERALRVAEAINLKNERTLEAMEKQQRTGSRTHNQKKADKRARDREIRSRMKSPKGSKS